MDGNINLTRAFRDSNRHSESRPAFTYQAIDTAKREIRLLGIQGLAGDPSILRCQLKNLSLDNEAPHFVAISYTWGTSCRMGKLEINWKILRIPYNAWDILHELRYRSQLFWIDSVCIDQTNTKERNHQVSMMRDIYSSADMVYVWLGRGTPDTYLAMAKLSECQSLPEFDLSILDSGFQSIPRIARSLKNVTHDPLTLENLSRLEDLPILRNLVSELPIFRSLLQRFHDAVRLTYFTPQAPKIDGFRFFFSTSPIEWNDLDLLLECRWSLGSLETGLSGLGDNPYWKRVWIVQEVVLAKSIYLLHGRCSLPWQQLTRLFSGSRRDENRGFYGRGGYGYDSLPTLVDPGPENSAAPILALIECKELYSSNFQQQGQGLDLKTLLELYEDRESTDRRDMVYGLLGLAEHNLTIDYSKRPYQVLFDVLRCCILAGNLTDESATVGFSLKIQKVLRVQVSQDYIAFLFNTIKRSTLSSGRGNISEVAQFPGRGLHFWESDQVLCNPYLADSLPTHIGWHFLHHQPGTRKPSDYHLAVPSYIRRCKPVLGGHKALAGHGQWRLDWSGPRPRVLHRSHAAEDWTEIENIPPPFRHHRGYVYG